MVWLLVKIYRNISYGLANPHIFSIRSVCAWYKDPFFAEYLDEDEFGAYKKEGCTIPEKHLEHYEAIRRIRKYHILKTFEECTCIFTYYRDIFRLIKLLRME